MSTLNQVDWLPAGDTPPQHDTPTAAVPERRKRRRTTVPLPPAPQTAKAHDLATDNTPQPEKPIHESQILERIRKCLERANHENTPEMEAKAALRLSSRLMAQFNVTQADMLADATTSEDRVQLGGLSKVVVQSTKRGGHALVRIEKWAEDVASAMTVFFDCKYYKTARVVKVEWTFYGIATNTVAAAMAFEMAFNLIMEWSRAKKGGMMSYRIGCATGLIDMAKEERKAEMKQAKEAARRELESRLAEEQDQRQREMIRLQPLPSQDGVEAYRPSSPGMDVDNVTNTNNGADTDNNRGDTNVHRATSINTEDYNAGSSTVSHGTESSDQRIHLESKSSYVKEEEHDEPFGFNDYLLSADSSDSETIKDESRDTDDSSDDSDEDEIKDESTGQSDQEIKPELSLAEENMKAFAQCFVDLTEEKYSNLTGEPSGNEDTVTTSLAPREAQQDILGNKGPSSSTSLWTSNHALQLFRQSAEKVADDYLKSKYLKFRKGRKRQSTIRNFEAFKEGKKDSRRIDVKRRRIEDGSMGD